MKNRLVFLEELSASEFGQHLLESYTIGTYIRGTNLSEVVMLDSLTNKETLILKAMSKQFGCTIDLEKLLALNHVNISQTLMHGASENYIYVVKPYYTGHTLEEFIHHYGPLSQRAVIDIMMPIADGVQYLHEQKPMLILRDLKPDNVIMQDDHLPIIVDLESSRSYSIKSQDTVILGTPGYASPEHYGVKETDARSDVYLLGMLLHFIITTEVWHQRKITHPRLLQENFNSLRVVIEKAIAFDPDQRYQTVGALKDALMEAMPNTQSSIPLNQGNHQNTQRPHWLFQTKNKTIALTLAIVLLLGTGAMGMQLVTTYKDAIKRSQQFDIQSDTDVLALKEDATSQTASQTVPGTPESPGVSEAEDAIDTEIEATLITVSVTNTNASITTVAPPLTTQPVPPTTLEVTTTVPQTTKESVTQTVLTTQTEPPATTSSPTISSGEVVIYRKGDRQELSRQVSSTSVARDLPLGLSQSPYLHSSFVTYLNLSKLPAELSDVDSMGVGAGPTQFKELYDHLMMRYNGGEPFVRHFASPGSNIVQFNSVGDYYYGNYIALYGKDKIRALVMVGIDESVAYKIYP